MRLISQYELVDVPYEKTVLTVIDGIIRAAYDGNVYVMGEYEPDEAVSEMNCIVNAYCAGKKAYLLPARREEE